MSHPDPKPPVAIEAQNLIEGDVVHLAGREPGIVLRVNRSAERVTVWIADVPAILPPRSSVLIEDS